MVMESGKWKVDNGLCSHGAASVKHRLPPVPRSLVPFFPIFYYPQSPFARPPLSMPPDASCLPPHPAMTVSPSYITADWPGVIARCGSSNSMRSSSAPVCSATARCFPRPLLSPAHATVISS